VQVAAEIVSCFVGQLEVLPGHVVLRISSRSTRTNGARDGITGVKVPAAIILPRVEIADKCPVRRSPERIFPE